MRGAFSGAGGTEWGVEGVGEFGGGAAGEVFEAPGGEGESLSLCEAVEGGFVLWGDVELEEDGLGHGFSGLVWGQCGEEAGSGVSGGVDALTEEFEIMVKGALASVEGWGGVMAVVTGRLK